MLLQDFVKKYLKKIQKAFEGKLTNLADFGYQGGVGFG